MTSDALVNCQSSSDNHNSSITGIDILDLLTAVDGSEGSYDDNFQENNYQSEYQPEPTRVEPEPVKKRSSDDMPSLSIAITNVVAMANMRCHLKLKEIARSSINVEYKALQNHVIMRLRHPYTVATIWSSGKIWCTGANSITKARAGARRIARRLAKAGFPCKFSNFRIVNIMATCKLPFKVRLDQIVKEKPLLMSYEPELAPGLNYKLSKDSSTSLKLFSTGRIILMGNSIESISSLVSSMVPIAAKHQTDEPVNDIDEDFCNGSSRKALRAARLSSFPEMPEEVIAAELDEKFIVYEGASSDEEDDRFRRCRNDDSDEFCHDFITEEDIAFINDGEIESGSITEIEEDNDSFYSGASQDSEGRSKKRRKKRKKKHKKRSKKYHEDILPDKSADPDPMSTFSRVNQVKPPIILPSVNNNTIKVFSATSSNQSAISGLDNVTKKALSSGSSKLAKIITYQDGSKESNNLSQLTIHKPIQKSSPATPSIITPRIIPAGGILQNQIRQVITPKKSFPNGLSLLANTATTPRHQFIKQTTSPNIYQPSSTSSQSVSFRQIGSNSPRLIVNPSSMIRPIRIPGPSRFPTRIISTNNASQSQRIISIPKPILHSTPPQTNLAYTSSRGYCDPSSGGVRKNNDS